MIWFHLLEHSDSFYRERTEVTTSLLTQVPELVNLQEVGGKAKPYQIRQFLRLVERHNLTLGDEE